MTEFLARKLNALYLTCYLGRHSPGSGCAGIHENNRVPNCPFPRSAILHPGYPDPHRVRVPRSEAKDAGTGVILIQRGHPRFELAATLLASMNWGVGVDDHMNDFASRMSSSIPKPMKSTLQKYKRRWSQWRRTVHDLDDGNAECAQTAIVEY